MYLRADALGKFLGELVFGKVKERVSGDAFRSMFAGVFGHVCRYVL